MENANLSAFGTLSPEAFKSGLDAVLSASAASDMAAGIQRLYDCSLSEALPIVDVLRIGKNKKNPTADSLIRAMLASIRSNSPLDLWMAQCIDKKPAVRLNKIDYFCKPPEESPRNVALADGAVGELEAKRWVELRSIQQAINANVLLLVGDQDFVTLDAMDEWSSSESMEQLRRDIAALIGSVSERATDFFGSRVAVAGWASLYGKQEFISELERAESTKDRWLVDKFKRASIRPYVNSWRYPEIAKDRGIPESVMMQFIEGDIVRTAAQYRIESRIAANRGVIQCWAETCGDSVWPITISNYDKQGVPPSIPLV